jgi:hypothetical protein
MKIEMHMLLENLWGTDICLGVMIAQSVEQKLKMRGVA